MFIKTIAYQSQKHTQKIKLDVSTMEKSRNVFSFQFWPQIGIHFHKTLLIFENGI